MPQIIPTGKPYNERKGRPSGQLEMVVGFLPVDGTYLQATTMADILALVVIVL
jgi:hypothetical protein